MGDVNEIDLPNKQVFISHGYRNHSLRIDYDHLVIAFYSIHTKKDSAADTACGNADG